MEVVAMGKSDDKLNAYPMHSHTFWEILVNISGDGSMVLQDKAFSFQKGNICVIPPNVPHQKQSEAGFIDISMLIKEMPPVGDFGYKIISDDENGTLSSLMDTAYHIYNNENNFSAGRVYVILNAIGETIFQWICARFAASRRENLNIDRFLERMEANIPNPDFNIKKEVERYGYNIVYFRKIFKQETGMTPTECLQKMRIEEAKKIFHRRGNSMQIKEVSAQCGFADPYYFTKVFRKQAKMSPSEYLAKLRQFDEGHLAAEMDFFKRHTT